MTILDTIIAHKFTEVEEARGKVSEAELRLAPAFGRKTLSLSAFLADPSKTGIIAEYKRKSPSKGLFPGGGDPLAVTSAYTRYGASGLSVLTDVSFFGGSTSDLMLARANEIPILRKDFVVDEYQILEAKAMGADVVLLIAASLEPLRVRELGAFAQGLGLEVLLELHADEELGHVCPEIDLVGINNRDLKTFKVDIARSLDLASRLPAGLPKVAESGISDPDTIKLMRSHGFTGFLIGETFMRETDPGAAFKKFVDQL
jgi:indole-3-glycerol phosphate synthase